MTITPQKKRILEEILLAEYHTYSSMQAALGIEGTGAGIRSHLKELAAEQYVIRRAMADDRFTGTGGTYHVFVLGMKALEEIDADPALLSRYRARIRSAQNSSVRNIPHDLLRTDFRIALLEGERRGEWTLDRWTLKRDLDLYAHSNGREVQLRPDAFFTLVRDGQARHFFLEIDTASYAVVRSDPEGGSSVLQKMNQYESLFERDHNGLWRLRDSKLDIGAFSVIQCVRESRSSNPNLARQRIETSKQALLENLDDLPTMKRQWLFVSESSLKSGRPIVAEDVLGRRGGLFR